MDTTTAIKLSVCRETPWLEFLITRNKNVFQREKLTQTRVEKMSLCTLPVLFFNMGGEMLYILDQRLRAQKVPQTKAVKGKEEYA